MSTKQRKKAHCNPYPPDGPGDDLGGPDTQRSSGVAVSVALTRKDRAPVCLDCGHAFGEGACVNPQCAPRVSIWEYDT